MDLKNDYMIRDDYLQKMNDDILNRRFPDVELKPNLDTRPISTKYSVFPIIQTLPPRENKQYLEHYTELNFAPCSAMAPFKKCDTHISLENELRGQNSKLYKGDLVNKFIPSIKSDMYNVVLPDIKPIQQPHPLLFQQNKYYTSQQSKVIDSNIGKDLLHNHTRTQLRNM